MNSEFWNIFQWNSNGFSDRNPNRSESGWAAIDQNPVGNEISHPGTEITTQHFIFLVAVIRHNVFSQQYDSTTKSKKNLLLNF